MLTLISTIGGYIVALFPRLFDILQDRADKKHELELAQLQIQRELEMRKLGFEAQERVEHIRSEQLQNEAAAATSMAVIGAQQAEMQALYAHDTAMNEGTSQWMKNLRASVRPVLTYGFFFLLVFVDVAGFWYGYYMSVPFDDLLNMLWDSDTQALFASIIAFHFGGRAFGK